MKPGRESQTSVMVATWRALADGSESIAGFEDPTACSLLPPAARAKVDRARSAPSGRNVRGGFARALLDRHMKMMVVRTIAIDEAVRDARTPQVVILGAGLDGRAWRMDELRDALVLEVDHPDTQREKRERVRSLAQRAREVRFVPVDFTRDDLDGALEAAGHDAAQPTTWIWEGVIMYLTPREVETTLAVIASRSRAASRLIGLYHSPFWMRHLVSLAVRRFGEPLRSAFTAEAMAALLARHGFRVSSDRDLWEIAQGLTPELATATAVLRHSRIVIAEKRD